MNIKPQSTILLQKQPIATAPRDGSTILLWFGEDGVSQGRYLQNVLNHPWQFIDKNGENWIINQAVDGPGGPSHWSMMPR